MEKLKRYERRFEDSYDIKQKYKKFNKLYFDNNLPLIKIKYVSKSSKFIAQVEYIKNELDTLTINLKYFETLSEKNKDAVLIHEMIHIWVTVAGHKRKGNLHQGEFLIKAKSIENRTGLKISGRTHKDSEDYEDVVKISVYAVIKTYTKKFIKKNAQSLDFYSSIDKAENVINNINKELPSYYYHLYKIQTNSPVVAYKVVEKNIDTSRGWLVYKNDFIRHIMDGIKKYPEYAELIKII